MTPASQLHRSLAVVLIVFCLFGCSQGKRIAPPAPEANAPGTLLSSPLVQPKAQTESELLDLNACSVLVHLRDGLVGLEPDQRAQHISGGE